MQRLRSVHVRLVAFAMALLVLCALFTGGVVHQRQQALAHRQLEHLTWAAYQLDRDVRELRMALTRATPPDSDTLLAHFAPLYRGSQQLARGPLSEALQAAPAAAGLLRDAQARLAALDSAFTAWRQDTMPLTQAPQALQTRAAALQSVTEQLLREVIAHDFRQRGDEHRTLAQLSILVLILVMLMLVAGLLLVAALLRERRERRRQAYQHTARHAEWQRLLQQQTQALARRDQPAATRGVTSGSSGPSDAAFSPAPPEDSLDENRDDRRNDAPHVDAASLTHHRVLVVDSDAAHQAHARTLLERLGQSVSVADSSEQAQALLDNGQFDLVLIDTQLPGRDALATAPQANGTHPPIIVMSARSTSGERQRARDAGQHDLLGRPVTEAELHRLLQQPLAS